MKEIKIGEQSYTLDCNALTYVDFKKIFGNGIYQDVNVIRNYMLKQLSLITEAQKQGIKAEDIPQFISNAQVDDLSDFIDSICKITYALIKTANNSFMSYETWLTSFNPKLQDDWISEVAEYTVECFC